MSQSQVRLPSAIFHEAARNHPDKEFLLVPAHGDAQTEALTYREALAQVEQIADRIDRLGYRPGHRVALALDNTASFFLHFLALNSRGCSVVPLNASMSRDELRYVLGHADVTAVFTYDKHVQHLQTALPENVPLANVRSEPLAVSPHGAPRAMPDESVLLYTSGTTGRPKGCVLTHAYFDRIGVHYTSLGGYCEFRPGSDRLITPLPVTHMNALACSFMAMLMTGGCLIQLDRFHPSTWWKSVRETRATCFHYLGVMPAMLLSAPPSPDDDVSANVRFGFGAGVDPRHHESFEKRFGVPLIEAWAMTETGGGAWITANVEPRHVGQRCFGRAPEGLEWRIVTEAGTDAMDGEPGELWVRRAGPDPRHGFFAGYYKDPAATEAAWEHGWFHTGDIVRVGPDGSFFFVDRLKNIVRRSGENIAAVEVESVLMQHPDVQACAVTAVPDDVRGEEVFAFVVARQGVRDRLQAVNLQRFCLEMLVYFKAPGYIAFVDSLPQTASQKLARGEVKRLAAQYLQEQDKVFDLRDGKKRPRAASHQK